MVIGGVEAPGGSAHFVLFLFFKSKWKPQQNIIFIKKMEREAGGKTDEAIQELEWCWEISDCLTLLSKIKQTHTQTYAFVNA